MMGYMGMNEESGILQTKDLSVGYSKKEAPLHQEINVSVREGEFICLLGPNGAGKSTLIKTLSGFLPPVAGGIYYDKIPLEKLHESKRAKMVSVVLTDRVHVQNLTVFELVSLGRTPYTGFFGKLTEKDVQLVYHAIEEVGLANYVHQVIDKMSDGERQKAMIAKALVQETPFIILDEPTAFLDLPAKLEIMQLLRRLSRDRKRGILLSTHDLEMALQIADKIWLLAQGRRLHKGIPEDLVLSNDFKQFFEREGIIFDNQTGSFKYHKADTIPIVLKDVSMAANWVGRALNRLGFEPVQEGSDWQVRVRINGVCSYALFKKDKLVFQCNSIEQLMDKVVSVLK